LQEHVVGISNNSNSEVDPELNQKSNSTPSAIEDNLVKKERNLIKSRQNYTVQDKIKVVDLK